MFDSIFSNASLTPGSVILSLTLALVLGTAASWFYTKKNLTTQSFALTVAVLPLITAAVIMVVNGNLGAGIAVAGSFSLIRFRSVQGSGQEILAVFLSASLGLCLGAGYAAVACCLLLLYVLAILLLSFFLLGAAAEKLQELRISVPEALDYSGLFDDLLNRYFKSSELVRVRTIEMGTAYQLTYHVMPLAGSDEKAFLDAARERNGNLPVSLGRIPENRDTM